MDFILIDHRNKTDFIHHGTKDKYENFCVKRKCCKKYKKKGNKKCKNCPKR